MFVLFELTICGSPLGLICVFCRPNQFENNAIFENKEIMFLLLLFFLSMKVPIFLIESAIKAPSRIFQIKRLIHFQRDPDLVDN